MRRTLITLVLTILLAACGRGAATQLTAEEAPAFNDTDVAFLQDMISHHQQAIDMAKLVDGRSRRPELAKLAGRIITGQGAEIRIMRGWLALSNRPAPAIAATEHDQPQVPGLLAPGQLEWLETLAGSRSTSGS